MRAWIPREHGQVAWGWGEGGLLEQAWAAWRRSHPELDRLREEGRRELGLPLARPVVAAGHQPLPVHPGILLRQLFLSALPPEVEGVWISVDSDAPPAVELAIPLRRRAYTFHRLVLERNEDRRILAALPVPSEARLAQAWERVRKRLATLENKAILERAAQAWGRLPRPGGNWAGWWEEAIARLVGGSGVRVIPVTELSATRSFHAFVELLLSRRGVFLEAYRRAADRAGVSPLAPGELPFWRLEGGKRRVARAQGEVHLPRALTLTFYLRTVVCDFFLHGVGGARYEPGVDLLFREVFRIEPPPWGWLTGTFLLPEPSERKRLPGREYPFFLHDLGEVRRSLAGPLASL